MENLSPDITSLTRDRFPAYKETTVSLEPLEKGGSDRKFYRICAHGLAPLIFVQYGGQREENKHYVEIGNFLEKAGVRVPKMILHEPADGRIWMEDLGETDLWASRTEPWPTRRPLYEATLRQVHRLHCAAALFENEVALLGLQPPFDAKLYHWEQEYFFSHCVGRHLGIPSKAVEPARARLHVIALELEKIPRCLIHRDFQSQNIVIQNGAPCLIDFQGMRFGLPQYDLASLLLDPYVDLTDEEQQSLLSFYCSQARACGHNLAQDFEHVYWLCAAQRLMQALGAYGFLGHEKGKASFLSHIPIALPRLIHVFKQVCGLDSLIDLLQPAIDSSTSLSMSHARTHSSLSC
jgi:N-acetylmuramate 1-kinase